MGCDFEFAIEVLIAGGWQAVLRWQGKTSCGGGPWVDATFTAAERGVCPAYGEPIKLIRKRKRQKNTNSENGKAKKQETDKKDEGDVENAEENTEGESQETQEEGTQEEETQEEGTQNEAQDEGGVQDAAQEGSSDDEEESPRENNDNWLFYSREGLDTVIRCLNLNFGPDYEYAYEMFKDVRVLCDLYYFACPRVKPREGEWCLEDAKDLIAELQAQGEQVDVAALPIESVLLLPDLSNLVRSYLHADDVRFRMYDDEGSSGVIRKAYAQGTPVPKRQPMICVIS